VTAQAEPNEVVVEFSDSGPGMADRARLRSVLHHQANREGHRSRPQRQLRRSAGSSGQITCRNKKDGGAVFTLRFPLASHAAT